MSTFERYAAYYDLLYQDKNYAAEADYVAATIRSVDPAARTILEFGSGTGRHGRLLAAMGFVVHGIERSAEMVAVARRANDTGERFDCEVGDIRIADAGRTFDAVIALFHVMCYQTTNDDLIAAFRSAARHLGAGGVFLFDVWHGPAVLAERPARRVKDVASERHRVIRTATPEIDTNAGIVTVDYAMECEDRSTLETSRFSESHRVRYLFPTEIDLFAKASGLARIRSEEFMTGRPPSDATWGVCHVLEKRAA